MQPKCSAHLHAAHATGAAGTYANELPVWTDSFRCRCNSGNESMLANAREIAIDRDWLEAQVLDCIRSQICAPDRLASLEARIREKIEARRRAFAKSPRLVAQRVAGVEKKIQHFYDAIGEGLNPAVCKEKIAELEREKAALEQEASMLRREDYYTRALEKNVAELRRFASAFRESFATLPFETQRGVVLHFVEEIRMALNASPRMSVACAANFAGFPPTSRGCSSKCSTCSV